MRIDHGHNHTPCTCIQRPLEPFNPIAGNAYKRCAGSCIGDGTYHISHDRRWLSAMFHMRHQPIKAEPRHHSCRGNTRQAQPCAQRWLTSAEFFLHMVSSHILFLSNLLYYAVMHPYFTSSSPCHFVKGSALVRREPPGWKSSS